MQLSRTIFTTSAPSTLIVIVTQLSSPAKIFLPDGKCRITRAAVRNSIAIWVSRS
jgi:hypothetical protein